VQSRLLLAIVLSAGVLFLWQWLFPAPKPTPKTPTPAPSPAPAEPGVPAPPPGDGAPAPSEPAPAPEPEPEAAESTFEVALPTGPWLRVGFTTRGGAVRYVTLRRSHEAVGGKEPLDVLLPVDRDTLTGMTEVWEGERLLVERHRVFARDEAEEARTPETDVVFTLAGPDGLRVRKRFVLPTEEGRFDADVSVSAATSAASGPGRDLTVRLVGTAGLAREPGNQASFGEPDRVVAHVLGATKDPVQEAYRLDPIVLDEAARASGAFRLVGIQSQYFASVLWHEGGRAAPRVRRVYGGGQDPARLEAMRKGLVDFFGKERDRSTAEDWDLHARVVHAVDRFHQAWADFDLPATKEGEAAAPATFHLYVGPLSREALGADRYEQTLRPLVTYPYAFDFLAVLLLAIFDFFDGLTGSAGLAVILMTLVVRLGMMPLSVRNQLSMRRHGRKLQKLKPKVEALKKKWIVEKNDRRRFQEEQVKLYREHGVGFPFGCLMLLIQIPVFMALFSSLRVEYGLRHRSFLWIEDLSGPDQLVDFGLREPLSLLGIPVGGFGGINLLPFLSIVLSLWQYKMMPKPTDEQQAQQMKMMKWMPIFFAVMLYNYTAALSLYMVFSSLVAIVESAWVRAKDRHEVEAAAAA
jgi:YidC/Oxa1 family membrane protein insertase